MFKYNLWANERVFNSLNEFKNPPDKAVELFSHIIASQIIWIDRIQANPAKHKTSWQKFSLSEINELYKNINGEWVKFVSNSTDADIEKEIEYQNTIGERFRNKIKDVITHVLNHSTYHRGQIASIVRKEGGVPAVTDYIAYKR
jgi:uncharacterized damage-inducible protein DinB